MLAVAAPLAGQDESVDPLQTAETGYVGPSVPVAALLLDTVPTLGTGALSLWSALWGGPIAVQVELVEQIAVAPRIVLVGKTRIWIGDGLHGLWQVAGFQVRPFGGYLSGCFLGLYAGVGRGESYFSGPWSFWSASADMGYQYVFCRRLAWGFERA